MLYSTHLLRHTRLTIGRNLHHHRRKKRWPLARLARLSGVCADMIDRYELGKNEIGLDDMLKLACALDLRVEALWASSTD